MIKRHNSTIAEDLRPGTRSAIIDLSRDSWDGGDPYGSAMSIWFAVADLLNALGEEIPREWEYRPGLGTYRDLEEIVELGEFPICEIAELLRDGYVSIADLRYAGNVIARYVGILKHSDENHETSYVY